MSETPSSSVISSIQMVLNEADCLYTHEQVLSVIEEMANKINSDLAKSNPILMVVMNGGLVFAGHLVSRLNFPLEIDYLHASRYGNNYQGETLNWHSQPSLSLQNRCVLLIDDILDEGKTLIELIEYCKAKGASDVKTAVLTEKKHNRKADPTLQANYCGLSLEDRFVFGFGMDYKGYWRNAQGIFAVKGL